MKKMKGHERGKRMCEGGKWEEEGGLSDTDVSRMNADC